MIRDRGRSDAGFSVAELVVASFIGLLALGAAYLVFETGMKGFKQVENTTIANRNAAQAMSLVDRPMRELQQLSIPKSDRIQFLADTNDDGNLERILIYLDGTDLKIDRASASGVGTVTSTVAQKIRNTAAGTPLFTYYGSVGGAPITSEASRTLGAKIIRVQVVVWNDATPTPPAYRVQTDVFLRNRGGG